MAPEQIGKSNMWRLFEGESVVGEGGEIRGPAVVRVYEFPQIDKILVQAGNLKVEVEGSDFSAAVRKTS